MQLAGLTGDQAHIAPVGSEHNERAATEVTLPVTSGMGASFLGRLR